MQVEIFQEISEISCLGANDTRSPNVLCLLLKIIRRMYLFLIKIIVLINQLKEL